MKEVNKETNEEKLRRYFEQAGRLPEEIEKMVMSNYKIDLIILYCFADLNSRFELDESWIVLSDKSLFVTEKQSGQWVLRTWKLDEINSLRQIEGLSANRLLLISTRDEVEVEIRYTQRQRRSFQQLVYLLEKSFKEKDQSICSKQEVLDGAKETPDDLYQKASLASVDEVQSSTNTKEMAVVWRLLGFLKPYRRQLIIGMSGAIALTLVSLIPAYLTGYVLDHVIRPHSEGKINDQVALQMAWLAIAGLVGVYVCREFFAWMRLRWMALLGEYVARDLRRQVYTHLHKLSLSFFSSKQTGSLISRVGSDTDRIWDFIAFGVVEVSSSLLMLTGLGAMLLWLDWQLGLIVVVPVPLILFLIHRHGQEMQRLFLRAWRKWSDLTDCLSDTIPGIRVVKAFNQQEREKQKFNQRNEATVQEFNRIHFAWTGFWPKLMLSIQGLVIAVWFFGVPRVLSMQSGAELSSMGGLSAGTFVSFILYLTMFTQPIEIIGQMARMVNRATSSAHRVFEVLDTEPQLVEIQDAVRLSPLRGEVCFKNVSFSYDGVRPIVKNVNFNIKPGEFIGLVGPSGGGKSTLTNLMTRFYDATGGQILVDGVDVKNLEIETFREQVGMVLQDPYLFHGTILENIRYSNPKASLAEVVDAAKAAHAHEFIMKLTHGYDTIVGERGSTLSGGERQRVSIARAVLRNPKILILDEATSAVDTETEFKIQEAIDRLVSGRTVIAIAHRLSTLRKADRLFVVKDGRIVESGTHEELVVQKSSLYAKLSGMQQKMSGEVLLH